MAHFAKLDATNVVLEVLVVDNKDTVDSDEKEVEQIGIDFLKELTGWPFWKKTSINNNIRKNYAHVGFKYDESLDVFYDHVKPFDSWIFNKEVMEWQAPVDQPADIPGVIHMWSELTKV